ncbi:MAG: 50S ribosomal protein L21, partial [Firmicutes bacterium]|nr:50S ribosomal protein L21 [Bacillota bacterium]
MVYAVMETGSKQYRVQPGEELLIEKLPADVGSEIILDHLLLVTDDDGTVSVGQPYLSGARAVATVVGQERAKKILVFKYKAK